MGRHKKVGRKKTLTTKQYKQNQKESLKRTRTKLYSFTISINKDKDKDIVELLEKQENKQKYIRELLKQQIK